LSEAVFTFVLGGELGGLGRHRLGSSFVGLGLASAARRTTSRRSSSPTVSFPAAASFPTCEASPRGTVERCREQRPRPGAHIVTSGSCCSKDPISQYAPREEAQTGWKGRVCGGELGSTSCRA
jgi:hypothetical protein